MPSSARLSHWRCMPHGRLTVPFRSFSRLPTRLEHVHLSFGALVLLRVLAGLGSLRAILYVSRGNRVWRLRPCTGLDCSTPDLVSLKLQSHGDVFQVKFVVPGVAVVEGVKKTFQGKSCDKFAVLKQVTESSHGITSPPARLHGSISRAKGQCLPTNYHIASNSSIVWLYAFI